MKFQNIFRVRNSAALALAAGTGLILGFPVQSLAQGGFEGTGRYEITNVQSHKVIDMDRNDLHSVIQFEPRHTQNQLWEIREARNGTWYIRNAMNGNALEEVSRENSTPVQANRFTGGPGQQWRILKGDDNTAMIVSSSGKALDIPNGSRKDGVKVQVYDRNGDENQRFTFNRVASTGSSDWMTSELGEDDTWASAQNRGAAVTQNTAPDASGRYWDSRDQMWKVSGDGVCFYREPGYRGDAYCVREGQERTGLGWNNAFASVKFFGVTRGVQLFSGSDFSGQTLRITHDEPDMSRTTGRNTLNQVSAIRVL